MPAFRSFLHLLIPGLIFAGAYILQRHVAVSVAWQGLLDLFPYISAVAGLFLGWRFNRTRVLWAIGLLILVERGLTLAPPFGREYLLLVAPLLVPLNLTLFCWWDERGLLTVHGLMRLLIVAAQVGVAAWLYLERAGEVMALIENPLLVALSFEHLPFPQVVLLAMALSLVGLLTRYVVCTEALEGSFFWAAVAVIAGFWWPEDFLFWGGVAAFVLTIAVVESGFSMAFNDELTGLPGRRALNEFLLKIGKRYTVAMVDIDHFKKVNDTHGHDVGDQVLKKVAACLWRVTGGGRPFRYGGEEFAVIFPGKDLEQTLPHLEELRDCIGLSRFVLRGADRPKKKPTKTTSKAPAHAGLQVTVSIGAATRDETNATPEQVIQAADQALYKAKKGGRNKVCTA